MGLILLVIIIILLLGAFPRWPYSQGWGYGPSGILGVILVVVLILFSLDEFRLDSSFKDGEVHHYLVTFSARA